MESIRPEYNSACGSFADNAGVGRLGKVYSQNCMCITKQISIKHLCAWFLDNSEEQCLATRSSYIHITRE